MTILPITPRSFRQVQGEHHELLADHELEPRYPDRDRTLDEDEMIELVTGCRALIVGVDPVTDAVLAAGPLALVVKYGAGLDNIDLDAAARRGVVVVPTPGTNAPSVAELTITMMLALARGQDLLSDEHFTVDGTLIEAWAGHKSFRPRDPGPASEFEKESPRRNFRLRFHYAFRPL